MAFLIAFETGPTLLLWFVWTFTTLMTFLIAFETGTIACHFRILRTIFSLVTFFLTPKAASWLRLVTYLWAFTTLMALFVTFKASLCVLLSIIELAIVEISRLSLIIRGCDVLLVACPRRNRLFVLIPVSSLLILLHQVIPPSVWCIYCWFLCRAPLVCTFHDFVYLHWRFFPATNFLNLMIFRSPAITALLVFFIFRLKLDRSFLAPNIPISLLTVRFGIFLLTPSVVYFVRLSLLCWRVLVSPNINLLPVH